MELGELLYVAERKEWRKWLAENHASAGEIWLVYYKKHSRKKRISYNDAVEEALCFGWIDSTAKPVDDDSWAQRFSPRRKNSALSELNKERIRRLIKARKMTTHGLESIAHHMEKSSKATSRMKAPKRFTMPQDVLKELKKDSAVWKKFQKFPVHYQHIRIAWIDGARKRPEEFKKRLRYFIKMTAQNKKFGMIQ